MYLLVSGGSCDDKLNEMTVSDAMRVKPYLARQTVHIDLAHPHTHTHAHTTALRPRCSISISRSIGVQYIKNYTVFTVVKVVMCSRGVGCLFYNAHCDFWPLRSRRTKVSIQCCTQKLHFKLTAPVYPAPGVECFSKANTK